ncbi:hypothetical protein R3P38DRAFT_2556032 [Favolaschia claudopus]|uniref:Uncharacterized protein n=1 Tax=Favolaschia claudopus TaxID=2862362 RepID=A0AAW0AAB9_9AGAR
MGVFELFCSFCAGPLCDAHSKWLQFLSDDPTNAWPPKDGEWRNPPGYPVPSKAKEEIVCISPEDGQFWNDWVAVGPKWEQDWISPPCEQGDYGAITIGGSSDWQDDDPGRYFVIHRGCLSFLCRHVGVTPKLIWESLYTPESDYMRYGERSTGLLYCLQYYDMEGRNGQEFGFAIERQTPREDDPDCVDRWDDPDSMDDTAWILTRPTSFETPVALDARTWDVNADSDADCMKVFTVPELLNLVLSTLIEVPLQTVAEELKESAACFDAPSLNSATKSLLALCQVNRFFFDAIINHRQGLFLQLASQYGWMLPFTPLEWKEWRRRSGPELESRLDQPLDWRKHLLTFLRKEELAIKNRWRFHRMAVQYARGRTRPATDTTAAWRWSVGELGLRSSLIPPEVWAWEAPPVTE